MLRVNLRLFMATARPDLSETQAAELVFRAINDVPPDASIDWVDFAFSEDGMGVVGRHTRPITYFTLTLQINKDGVAQLEANDGAR